MNTRKIFVMLLLVLLFEFPKPAKASSDCDNRYLTLVNPVRSRFYWQNKSLYPIISQYELVNNSNFSATWLIQYDVLKDSELVGELKSFNEDQEIGLFLEVSEDFAYDSEVIYPHAKPWTDPLVLFLSGYTQSERRKLIDKLFLKFKNVFGYYPKSVGAWWIDSYSLEYMEEKYGIDTVLIVADQKTTDDYGVWGQWWGVPYYPAKYNILKPASDVKEQADYVVIQWAQRDPTKAYGNDYTYSNYSLQANDYLDRGLDTKYFKKLVINYLDCSLPFGQITVGLETGIEGTTYIEEYKNQLEYLKSLEALQSMTMSEFSRVFKNKYISNPEKIVLRDNESEWVLTKNGRVNEVLDEKIDYTNIQAFSDYFVADKNDFLNRRLTDGSLGGGKTKSIKVFVLPVIVSLVYAWRKNLFKEWLSALLFLIAAYGLLLKSGNLYGWKVFYGPVASNLDYVNLVIVTFAYLGFFQANTFLKKLKQLDLSLVYTIIPLTFGLDTILRFVRYTKIEGRYYLGIVLDTFDFVGVTYPEIKVVTFKLSHTIAGAMLKFDTDKIWSSFVSSFITYPLLHIVLAVLLSLVLSKIRPRIKFLIILILTVFFAFHLYYIFTADPRAVVKI